MTIDEKALEIAIDVYCKVADEDGDIRNAVHEILTAYEAALWRPIKEAKSDDGLVLVAWLGADSRGFGSAQLKVCPGETGGVRQWVTNNEVVAETSFPKSMFRTIDPPPLDAVSQATSTPPAAEASS